MNIKEFFTNCCLVTSAIGFVFFFYLFLICAFSPDRFHILTHKDEKLDDSNYTTAWTTAATGCFLFLLLTAGLFMVKFNN